MANYVEINPLTLNYARQIVNQDTAKVVEHFAKKSKQKFKLTKERLREIETIKTSIDFELLREFASLYKRPLSFFFLSTPPVENFIPKDFRTHSSVAIDHELSTKTIFEIRKAKRLQYISSQEFQDFYSHTRALKKHTIKEDPVELAKKYREVLGVTLEEQSKQKDPLKFFRLLRDRMEKAGIIIYKGTFPIEDGRAFSFVKEYPYLIIINNRDGTEFGYAPKIFSLVHEFAHILIREESICNDFVSEVSPVERFCNSFAANFLIPEIDLSKKIKEQPLKTKEDIINFCDSQRKIYSVSLDAVLYRLKSSGMVDQNRVDEILKEKREKYDAKINNTDKPYIPFVTPAQKVVNSQGQKFVELVLEAKGAERITAETAAEYLNTKAKNLKSIESEITKISK